MTKILPRPRQKFFNVEEPFTLPKEEISPILWHHDAEERFRSPMLGAPSLGNGTNLWYKQTPLGKPHWENRRALIFTLFVCIYLLQEKNFFLIYTSPNLLLCLHANLMCSQKRLKSFGWYAVDIYIWRVHVETRGIRPFSLVSKFTCTILREYILFKHGHAEIY